MAAENNEPDEEHPSLAITGTRGSALAGRLVVLAVCGSVAAVKSFELCRELMRHGAKVQVVMSDAALKLLSAELMHYASGRPVITSLTGKVEHVDLLGKGGSADLLLIAPATANTISKIAMGIDDTPITTMATTAIGAKKPVLIVPAMHYSMWEHPIVGENLAKLEAMGRVKLIAPMLAEGKAKIPETDLILLETLRALNRQPLRGKKILVAGGPTWIEIDPIRIITSKSSGITGREIAREAYISGAEVTIVQNGTIEPCIRNIEVKGSREMMAEVMAELRKGCDAFVCCAALSDFEVKKSNAKLKSGKRLLLELLPSKKLIELVRKEFPNLFVAAFKAETNLPEKKLALAAKKLMKKNRLQLVVANDIAMGGIGGNENKVLLVQAKGNPKRVKGSKREIAREIVKLISSQLSGSGKRS